MISRRRLSVLLLGAAGATAATGCTTFENSDAVATVNGADVSQADLDAALEALGTEPPAADGTSAATTPPQVNVGGDIGRGVLGFLIAAHASRDFLSEAGEEVTADELAAAGEGDETLARLPEDLRTLFIEYQASQSAWGRIGIEEAEAAYNESPYASGANCLRFVVVDSEEALADVQAELDEGRPFEEVAREHSIDDNTREAGGALTDAGGSECLASSGITQESAGELALTVMGLGAGEYSEPIEQPGQDGSTTWGILYARPFAEVAESAASLHGPAAFTEYLGTVDVTVDPRYGRWDPESASVVPLSP